MSEANTHLERLKRLTAPGATVDLPTEAEDEYSAFGAARVGTKPQLTLVFRTAAGVCRAFAYAHLYTVDYDPSAGMAMTFTQHRVGLVGRHLDDLFRYLCSHRVQTVQEVDPLHAEVLPPGTPVVTGIAIEGETRNL